jgi:hypothetical protein
MSGTQQWGRICKLVVAPASGQNGLDLSAMRISFRATSRVTLAEPDTLEARVYNLAPSTVQSLLAISLIAPGTVIPGQGMVTSGVVASNTTGTGDFKTVTLGSPATPPGQVLLQAGYEGNFGTIFQGQLVQIRLGRESPMDDYVDIFAADGDVSHRWGMMNRTLAAGWQAKDVAQQAVQACSPFGLTGGDFPDETDPPQRPAPRGKVCFGMMRDILNDVASTHRVSWWINRNSLEFLPVSAYKPGDAVVITSKTGMVGLPHQTNFGVSVRCLLNPAISRGSQIKIDNTSVQRQQFSTTSSSDAANINSILATNLDADGFYKALMVNHIGDTRGNEWYTEVEGLSIDPTRKGILAIPDQTIMSLLTR